MEARQCEFWCGTLLLIAIDVLVRCHAEHTVILSDLRPFPTNCSFKRSLGEVCSYSYLSNCLATIFSDTTTFRHHRNIFHVSSSRRTSNVFIAFDGLSSLFKTSIPFVNLGSHQGGFTIHLT
ncbi:hypothetical protein TNCV_2920731 [Trichonephila clavipes]|nr:hypothetical protein TNCV_2920731 [Trichonephila clavipes]